MPTETTSYSVNGAASHIRKYHAVIGPPYRCDTNMTVMPAVSDGSYVTRTYSKTRNWVRSVPWPVPAGQLKPVNPYSVVVDEMNCPQATAWTELPEVGAQCYDRTDYIGELGAGTSGACNVAAPPLDTQRLSWCQGRAMLNFLLKVKDQKSQLMVTLAESRQTLNMLTSTAKAVASFRTKWLKNLSRQLRRNGSPKELHSSWLAVRYGWMPLYYDAYGIAKHLVDLSHPLKDIYPVRAFANWSTDNSAAADWSTTGWKGRYETRTTHRYKAGVGGFVTIERRIARELVRAGLVNPLEVLWEVLPYSFVVDWFIKVGDYVEGMTALNGVALSYCWASTHTDRAVAKRPLSTAAFSAWQIGLGTQNSARKQEYFRNATSPSLLHVGLTDLVDFDLQKQSWKHWIDAVALLRAAFRER